MYLSLEFDKESSKALGKIVFYDPKFKFTREDLVLLKKKKLLKYIDEDTFPEQIDCQVLLTMEPNNIAKIIFFDPERILPSEISTQALYNKNIITRSHQHG